MKTYVTNMGGKKMNIGKKFSVLSLLFAAVLVLTAGLANAAIDVTTVELNGREVYDTANANNMIRNLGRNNEVEVSVEIVSDVDVRNVEIEAEIQGLEHDSDEASDSTEVFDMVAGVTYVKDMRIELPGRMDDEMTYRLRVRIEDQSGPGVYQDYFIYVDSEMHSMEIKDVLFSPEYEVQAGRALLAEVQLRNNGLRDQDGVKVRVSIPELGVAKTTIMDGVDADDTEITEPLFLRIPDCAKAGSYDAMIYVEYHDGDEVMQERRTINVVESETCSPSSTTTTGTSKTLVSLPATQDVVVGGSESVFPVLLTNAGDSSKTYNIVVRGVDSWGSFRVEPSMSQIISAGQTSPVYVYVTANEDATAGEKSFFVEIQAGTETKQLPLTANLVKGEAGLSGLRKALEIGLIVFVVLLVVLGLIIGYNKMKENDNEDFDGDEDTNQTYY